MKNTSFMLLRNIVNNVKFLCKKVNDVKLFDQTYNFVQILRTTFITLYILDFFCTYTHVFSKSIYSTARSRWQDLKSDIGELYLIKGWLRWYTLIHRMRDKMKKCTQV
jgi:hypothetical protein